MAYAQTSYSQRLGNGPYTIADAGCFITAFANLLQRYGTNIDPPTLNQYFIDHHDYLHDPAEPAGMNDDVAWSTISSYDGQVSTTHIGGAGWPSTNDAIVKFVYKSTRTGAIVTHFCLVVDHSNGTIIDSWDGQTKRSPYGTPQAWASYERHAVQPVTPPAPVEQPAFTIENIPETIRELKVDTHIWDLNQRSWPAMVNNPVGTGGAGTKFKTVAIAHHVLGGAYYLPEGSTTQGYNKVDTKDPDAPAPAPVVEAAVDVPVTVTPAPVSVQDTLEGVVFTPLVPDMKKMYVVKPGGAEKWNFKGVKNWGDFKSVQHLNYGDVVYISGSALHPLGARYEVNSNDWNGFDVNGQPHQWYGFNKVDLSDKQPPSLSPTPAPVVVATPVVSETAPAVTPVATPATEVHTEPAATTAPIDWQTTYRPLPKPTRYCATTALIVSDLSGQKQPEKLPAYDFKTVFKSNVGVVRVFGEVTKDNVEYWRLKTNNDPNFSYWYCVPKLDPRTRRELLVLHPDEQPQGGIVLTRNVINESVSGIEKLLRAILPMWFNKKQK